MGRKLTLRTKTSRLRCALCHDALGVSSLASCAECGVLSHAECRDLIGRCPTLGCRERRTRAVASKRLELSPVTRVFLAIFALIVLASCASFAVHIHDRYVIARDERAAVASLKCIQRAQELYRSRVRADGSATFADLAQLGAEGLIDPDLATGTKDGYCFAVAVPRFHAGWGPSPVDSWEATATPVASSLIGRRFFATKTSYRLFARTDRPFSIDFRTYEPWDRALEIGWPGL